MKDINVDVYPVGLLDDLLRLVTVLPTERGRTAKYAIKRIVRSSSRAIKYRKFSYFNGFLAEPTQYPESLRWTRCGHAWTRRRALADLHRHLEEMNP